MAQFLSDRELRMARRLRAREEQLQIERDTKERERIEHELRQVQDETGEIEYEHVGEFERDVVEFDTEYRLDDEIDRESALSDLDTIGQFFHEDTERELLELESNPVVKVESHSGESNLRYIDEHIDSLENTLRELEKSDTASDKLEITDVQSLERSRYDDNSKKGSGYSIAYKDRDTTYRERHNKEMLGTSGYKLRGEFEKRTSASDHDGQRSFRVDRQEALKREHEDYESKMEHERMKIRNEQDEIKSRSSLYERESLKIKKLQLEEDKRHQLMLEKEKMLSYEIERKANAEKECIERIKLLEQQEMDLNRKKNENERLERKMVAEKLQEQKLNKRLYLLKQKERLLTEIANRRKLEAGDHKNDSSKRTFDVNVINKCEPKVASQEKVLRYKASSVRQVEDVSRKDKLSDTKDVPKQTKTEYAAFKLGSPKVPNFNGKHFEQWKLEVECLLKSKMYPDFSMVQAVRNSLQDDTREVLQTMKPSASAEEIIRKLTDIYGNVKTSDRIVQEFYSAVQKEGESCSAWGVRVETLFQKAVEKGEIDEVKRSQKLKERFWRGLRSEKSATRVAYESTESFESLRKKARLEEEEYSEIERDKLKPTSATVNQQKDDTVLRELLQRLKNIETDMGNLKKSNSYNRGNFSSRGYSRGYRKGYGGYRGIGRGNRDRLTQGDRDNERKETSTENRGKEQKDKSLNGNKLSSGGTTEAGKSIAPKQ